MRFDNIKRGIIPVVFVCAFPFSVSSQDAVSPTAKDILPAVRLADNISVKFGGFIRADYYFDSREMVGAVDDLFGFFPEPKKPDGNGKDLNAAHRHYLSTQATRFNALLLGPDFLNARSTAFFEYDFTGGGGINLRLRHAWVKLSWAKVDLLLGKTWNPMAESPFPSVAGLHTGVPFRPFGRGDQIRITYRLNDRVSILAAGLFQTEHKSVIDPSGGSDTRANPIPELHLQVHYKYEGFSAGLMGEYKIIRPATETTGTGGTFKTSETLSSYALNIYADYSKKLFNVKGGVTYGQNLSEFFQQGGYAVRTLDPYTGARTYSASNVASGWVNVSYGKTWMGSLFAGYVKNLGFNHNLLSGGEFYGRWQNVDHIYRIAPSVKYSYKQWSIHAELDYNVAGYGTINYANKGKVEGAQDISGVRGLLATTFYF